MSDNTPHGASKIEPAKGGGGKWLLGGLAAIVLLGAGYFAWSNFAPGQDRAETAYNDPYADEPLRAGPLQPEEDASADDLAADDAVQNNETQTARLAPQRTTPRTTPVPEQTIGVTPASLTSTADDDEIVVTARRPIWTRTPSPRRLSTYYPQRMLDRGREGEARLACVVQARGALDCDQVEATPGGFGTAAERLARAYRHAPTLADGSDAIGTPVNLRVVFRIADEDRRGRGFASR